MSLRSTDSPPSRSWPVETPQYGAEPPTEEQSCGPAAQAAERLLPGGWLIVEFSPMIARRVVELVAADRRFEPATTIKDLAGQLRVFKAQRKP